jgi:S1-C subfamily serine protease
VTDAETVDLRFAEGDWRVVRVVGIEDTPIDSHEELVRYLITETDPGQTLDLRIVRGGRETTERVRLEERPDPDAESEASRRRLRG